MTVDLVIPTYGRAAMLRETLLSLLRYNPPEAMDLRVLVVNNNSPDRTEAMLQEIAPAFRGQLRWVLETKPGSSHARNAGVRATQGEIIAFLDDDEQITETWYQSLHDAFQDPQVGYIGGPMLPNWKATPPAWLPVWEYNGVLSIVDIAPHPVPYGPSLPGMLISGNCVFRRSTLDLVGLYRPDLGRGPRGLGCGEDHDLYLRLLKSGVRGIYIPKLAILHTIPPERLTASYYRRWILGQAIGLGRMGRHAEEGVPLMLGIPLYLFGSVARRTLRLGFNLIRGRLTRKEMFIWELSWRQLAGVLYGTHWPLIN